MPDRSDFELGDEPLEVERPRRAGVVLSVRLSPDEADQLQSIAESRRITLSQVAREAITGYLRTGPAPPASAPWTGTTTGQGSLVLMTDFTAIQGTSGAAWQTDAPAHSLAP